MHASSATIHGSAFQMELHSECVTNKPGSAELVVPWSLSGRETRVQLEPLASINTLKAYIW